MDSLDVIRRHRNWHYRQGGYPEEYVEVFEEYYLPLESMKLREKILIPLVFPPGIGLAWILCYILPVEMPELEGPE